MTKILRIFFLTGILLSSMIGFTQDTTCATSLDTGWLHVNAPARYQAYMNYQTFADSYANSTGGSSSRLMDPNGIITIPVVVHVLHNGEAIGQGLNISDAQIQSQIDVLNEVYQFTNASRFNTPSDFVPRQGNMKIEFKLACVDPNGNVTNGIVRKQGGHTQYFSNDYRADGTHDEDLIGIKRASTGDAAWPTDRYLNIWTCDVYHLLGYSSLPSDYSLYPNDDGVVCNATAFGRVGNLQSTYNLGITGCHEVGHWLGLLHLTKRGCLDDDFVGDTPKEKQQLYSCPPYPDLNDRCDVSDPSTMYMNFMEYTPDACMNLFTKGQVTRVRSIFANLNGVGGVRYAQVNNYFDFSGQPTTINCTGSITISRMCLPVTWTISGPATIISGQNTNTIQISSTANGTVHLTATYGNYTASTDVTVTFGAPAAPDGICGPGTICYQRGVTGTARVCTPVAGLTYSWQIDGMGAGTGSSITINPLVWGVGTHTIQVRGNQTGCGYSAWKTGTFIVKNCTTGSAFTVSPNPATSTVTASSNTLTTSSTTTSSTNANSISSTPLPTSFSEINIYDQQGILKKHLVYNKVKSATIDISNIPTGIYIIEIIEGTYSERQQLQVLK